MNIQYTPDNSTGGDVNTTFLMTAENEVVSVNWAHFDWFGVDDEWNKQFDRKDDE